MWLVSEMAEIPDNGLNPHYQVPLDENPKMAELIGYIMAQHTAMEEQLRDILVTVTGMDQRYSRILFYTLPNRQRREVLKDCIAIALPNEADEWADFLDKKVKPVSDRRNTLAHHVYGGSGEDKPLALFDPKMRPTKKGRATLTINSLRALRYEIGTVNDMLNRRRWRLQTGQPWPGPERPER